MSRTPHQSVNQATIHRNIVRRGILQQFNPATYTATVLLPEATNTVIQNIPVACHIDGTSSPLNANCALLFFDAQNLNDALILAVYPNGTQGVPTPPPGRVVFVTGYQQFQNQSIGAGNTLSLTVNGGATGIPIGALGVIYKLYFTSPTPNAFLHLAPHGASDITAYASVGSVPAANGYPYGTGLLPIDANGRIDIKANIGNCTVTLYTFGYIF